MTPQAIPLAPAAMLSLSITKIFEPSPLPLAFNFAARCQAVLSPCIPAPIMDVQNRAIAGIAISGTKGSINVKTVSDLAIKVKNTAKLISNKLNEN